MMGTMLEYIDGDSDLRKRFVDKAFEENPQITNLENFSNALFSAFDTDNGKRASKWFNDEETLRLFRSEECRDRLRENVPDEEIDRLFGEIKRGEWEIERGIPKGEIVKPAKVEVVFVPKTMKVKRGVLFYNRSVPRKWTKPEIKFLQVRKQKKMTPKKIALEFNTHFKDKQRTSSSISSKIYRS